MSKDSQGNVVSGRFRFALSAYAATLVIPLMLLGLAGRGARLDHPRPWLELASADAISLVCGLAVAALLVVSTPWIAEHTRWGHRLRLELRGLIGGASALQCLVLGVASGVAEEVLFRAWLQPLAGWSVATLLFGLAHWPPRRALVPWTLWAALVGAIFGLIYELTGSLIGPMVAHAAVNVINLGRLARDDARFDAEPSR